MATRIRGKSKQALKSLKIEPETFRSESRALANWATTAPSIKESFNAKCENMFNVQTVQVLQYILVVYSPYTA